jgi:hypothetical protein
MMLQQRIFMILVVVVSSLGILAPAAQAAVLRCKSSVLTTGDSSAEVLIKCGKPLLVEPLTQTALSEDGQLTQVTAGERWTFDMGKGMFMQIVTVQNGVIQKIEDGPRN